MSPQQSGGSGRRRIAGDAARRRREAAARTSDEPVVDDPASEDPEPEVASDADEAGTAEAEPCEAEVVPAAEPRQRRSVFSSPARETWWWLALLAVITVCALVFVAVVGSRYLSERSDDEAFAEGREEAASAAATSAEEILSYDYDAFDAERVDAEKRMTDDFRQEYEELYSGEYCEVLPEENCTETGTFQEVIKEREQQVTASVVDVAPLECGDECSDSETKVLLFIDQATTAAGEELPPVGTQAMFTMVEQDGEWLVDNIE
ncbi:MAG: hypothetical protein ACRDO7_13770 [Nocardioidaceae bacterium]